MGEKKGYREAVERMTRRVVLDNRQKGGQMTHEQAKKQVVGRVKRFETRYPNKKAE
jgi:hypothetical protein